MGRVEKSTNAGKDYKLTINFGGTHRDILSSFVQKAQLLELNCKLDFMKKAQ